MSLPNASQAVPARAGSDGGHMAEPTAWMSIDGKLVKYADAKIHLRSPAVRYGAGVFEGLRAYWNKAKNELFLFRLDAHWTRLANSMEMVRMRQSPDIPD